MDERSDCDVHRALAALGAESTSYHSFAPPAAKEDEPLEPPSSPFPLLAAALPGTDWESVLTAPKPPEPVAPPPAGPPAPAQPSFRPARTSLAAPSAPPRAARRQSLAEMFRVLRAGPSHAPDADGSEQPSLSALFQRL
ncbi:MAG TPA: hypothetical protein VMA86_11150 [Acetobacteraceae bacterium]|nr:hypothetical protein [Acetobacteraceae bacterium]